MLKTQFYVFTSKKTKDKLKPEKAKKTEIESSQKTKKRRPAELVVNLSRGFLWSDSET